jgi:hypothetical protein
MIRVNRWYIPLLLASALVACTSGAGTAPVVGCAQLTVVAPPPLLYPVNGATGLPDGNFNVILGYAYGSLALTAPDGTVVPAASPVPAPSPLPSSPVTPSPSSTPVAYPVPALKATTSYTMIGTLTPATGCSFTYNFGSFTTR